MKRSLAYALVLSAACVATTAGTAVTRAEPEDPRGALDAQVRAAQAQIRAMEEKIKEVQGQIDRSVQEALDNATRPGAPPQLSVSFPEVPRPELGPGPGGFASPPSSAHPFPPSPHQRLMHLHEATQHLQAAGMPELARQAAQQAENLQRELAQHPPAPPAPGFGPGGEPGPRRLEHRIDELAQAVQQIHQELEALRRALQDQRGSAIPPGPGFGVPQNPPLRPPGSGPAPR